ncbi:MAG TPA: LacI family DNA-binding transcriptional regulator [Acidobacteriaceae bacterium]|jgi:LacI family transcriptional regulator|nr:LacI family DNA-binding transcriptional regulator [Acidobacteriaceae bacterium]
MKKSKVNDEPTLDDVARMAGVSSITVSRLVNGGTRVRPETAKKIRAAIARLGYKPNEAARILKGQPAKIIGLIVPDLADSFYGACAQAVHEVARSRSYMTVVVGSECKADVESLEIEMMIRRRVAGLLLIPTGVDKTPIQVIQKAGIPVVCFDRTLPGLEVDSVVVNNRDSSYEAAKHLIEHGHKNILCLGNQSNLYPIRLRIQGYEDAVREAGLPSIVVEQAETVDAVGAELVRLMQSKHRPTAAFCVNNVASQLLLEAAAPRRYQIPKHLAVIGFDDFKMATLLKPRLTVVRQPVVEMSRRAASILLDRLTLSSHSTTATVILSTELVIRESCGCAP